MLYENETFLFILGRYVKLIACHIHEQIWDDIIPMPPIRSTDLDYQSTKTFSTHKPSFQVCQIVLSF